MNRDYLIRLLTRLRTEVPCTKSKAVLTAEIDLQRRLQLAEAQGAGRG